jgi:FdrA protein
MQLQAALAELPGVLDAGAVMATTDNQALLAANDLLPEEAVQAGPGDLLVVVKAETEDAAAEALSRVDALLVRGGGDAGDEYVPRSLESAIRILPAARWALISVPGRFAARVTGEALDRGLHIFLYSDGTGLRHGVDQRDRPRVRQPRAQGLDRPRGSVGHGPAGDLQPRARTR